LYSFKQDAIYTQFQSDSYNRTLTIYIIVNLSIVHYSYPIPPGPKIFNEKQELRENTYTRAGQILFQVSSFSLLYLINKLSKIKNSHFIMLEQFKSNFGVKFVTFIKG